MRRDIERGPLALQALDIDPYFRVRSADQAHHQAVGIGQVKVQWWRRQRRLDIGLAVRLLGKAPSGGGRGYIARQHRAHQQPRGQKLLAVAGKVEAVVTLLFACGQQRGGV